jgi:hypothetical protein
MIGGIDRHKAQRADDLRSGDLGATRIQIAGWRSAATHGELALEIFEKTAIQCPYLCHSFALTNAELEPGPQIIPLAVLTETFCNKSRIPHP